MHEVTLQGLAQVERHVMLGGSGSYLGKGLSLFDEDFDKDGEGCIRTTQSYVSLEVTNNANKSRRKYNANDGQNPDPSPVAVQFRPNTLSKSHHRELTLR